MPDDHSEVEPLLPIPNRTVKRFSADDSEHSLVKVGHRQAIYNQTPRPKTWGFVFVGTITLRPQPQRAGPRSFIVCCRFDIDSRA